VDSLALARREIPMNIRYLFNRTVLLFSIVAFMVAPTFAQDTAKRLRNPHGAAVNGLQMSLLSILADDSPKQGAWFKVELRNVGDNDLILNLGTMLANGRRQYPDSITLLLTYPSGKEQPLVLLGPVGVAGRIDPLVVPLPRGDSFVIPVDLSQFAPFGQGPPELAPGSYALQAEFQGKAGIDQNLDMQGMALMHYWTGTIVSNRLRFELAEHEQKITVPN
jgi:hypothetical protein